uniref:SUEL-type lectin domain-containing protein n=1 Tax=Oryzias latipes TaxID=8090 RepID=A0A3P9HYU6_ORYLA
MASAETPTRQPPLPRTNSGPPPPPECPPTRQGRQDPPPHHPPDPAAKADDTQSDRGLKNTGLNDIIHPDPCIGIYKYLQSNFTCVPAIHIIACEHSYAHLNCGQGEVIFVLGANYGHQDKAICYLGGKNCNIFANNLVFGDPCGDTFKYLELAYVCLVTVTSGL